MGRMHDMIGRWLLAEGGPIRADVLDWRPPHIWQPVLDEMGLVLADGLIQPMGPAFQEGWDTEANQWRPACCHLYRFYDADGVLLYVGISGRIRQRVKEHAAGASWFEVAARVDIQHLPNRKEAADAERAAIKAERPLHNVMHAERPTPLAMPPTKPPRRNP